MIILEQRQVAIVQWLGSWVHTQVVQVRFPAGDLPTESVTVKLSRHFYTSPHVGHARRSRPVLDYRITDSRSLEQLIDLIQIQNILTCSVSGMIARVRRCTFAGN